LGCYTNIGNYLEQEGQDEGDAMEEEPNEEAQRFVGIGG
jgi:hypothetical protein